MEERNFQYLEKWDQDRLSKKAGYPDGMCLIWAFHFGALRMSMPNPNDAMREIVALSQGKRELLIKSFENIGFGYANSSCENFKQAVINIAIQYDKIDLIPELKCMGIDYSEFNKTHISAYGDAGLHGTMVQHLFANYYNQLCSNRFLMIGVTCKDLGGHAMCLVITPTEEIVIFEPTFGLLKINSLVEFFEDYGRRLEVIRWELVLVEQV